MGAKGGRLQAPGPPEIQLLDFLYGEWGVYMMLPSRDAIQPEKVPAVNASSQSLPEGDSILLDGFNYTMEDQSHTYSGHEKADDTGYGVYP